MCSSDLRPQTSASGGTGNKLSEGQAKAIFAICKSKNIEEKSFLLAHGCQSKSDLTMKEASELIEILNGLEKAV